MKFIHSWIAASEPNTPFKDIVNEFYEFGGWKKIKGATLIDPDKGTWSNLGDPDMVPIGEILRDHETIWVYNYDLVAFYTENEEFEVARLD